MTLIYNTYYPAISDERINLTKVNFSAYVVDSTYIPQLTDKKTDVNGRIETLTKILVAGDISTLTMSEIIEKVTSKLSDDELKLAAGFVVYDIASGVLCFYETLDKMNYGE